jgi:membrane-associated phospholipid phosphatase
VADRPTERPPHDPRATSPASSASSATRANTASRASTALSNTASRWPSVRATFVIVLAAYVVLTAAVVLGSPLDVIDRAAAMSDLAHRFPHAAPWVLRYVMLGQRGPSSHVAFVYLVWRAIRQRSWRPLVLLVTALTMLNLTVGTVKIAIGRLGPSLTMHPRAVFDGGDIFPSGHTSNAVVIFGVVAMVAVEHRRAMIALAVFVATTVGLSTIFLDTHWVTDVLGGWFAGALVLLALPVIYARLEQWAVRATRSVKDWLRVTLPVREWLHHRRWQPVRRPARDATSDMLTEDVMSR